MRLRRTYRTFLLAVLVFAGAPTPASGQIIRSPELSLQFHRAEAAWKSGASVLEAKARVDRVLEELPGDVAARKLRAEVLLAMERSEEALQDARQAVELAPGDGEAYVLLCEAARLSGHREEALEALEAASERVLEGAGLHVRLSWNAEALGQLEMAEAFGRIALALGETEPAAYLQLARVFTRQGNRDAAAAVLSRGLRTSVLIPQAIRSDTVLVRVVDHPDLARLMRR